MSNELNLSSTSLQSEANQIEYIIQQVLLNQVNTIVTGIIEVVNTDGTYNVQPSINYILTGGKPKKPPLIMKVPQAKIRFGNAEIKGRFKKGDAVIMGVIQRDITNLRNNWKAVVNPASYRKFAIPDAIILNGASNENPETYIELKDEEIGIVAPTVKINGSLIINGTAYVDHTHSAGDYEDGDSKPVTGSSGAVDN